MLAIIHGGEQTYWSVDSKASFSLLICLSFGLVVSFSILIHNIRKYYKGKMIVEMRWLSILFGVFSICYTLRAVYQYGLGSYNKIVTNMVVRWHLVNTLPLLFDIFPICAILTMHHMNFQERKDKDSRGLSIDGRHPYHTNRDTITTETDGDP